jgi:hypothetical protein
VRAARAQRSHGSAALRRGLLTPEMEMA